MVDSNLIEPLLNKCFFFKKNIILCGDRKQWRIQDPASGQCELILHMRFFFIGQ